MVCVDNVKMICRSAQQSIVFYKFDSIVNTMVSIEFYSTIFLSPDRIWRMQVNCRLRQRIHRAVICFAGNPVLLSYAAATLFFKAARLSSFFFFEAINFFIASSFVINLLIIMIVYCKDKPFLCNFQMF